MLIIGVTWVILGLFNSFTGTNTDADLTHEMTFDKWCNFYLIAVGAMCLVIHFVTGKDE